MNKPEDYEKVATREQYYSTLARKEGQEAAKRAKIEKVHHMLASAADSRREAYNAFEWAKKRKRWSEQAREKE